MILTLKKSQYKQLVKLLLTTVALFFVFTKINLQSFAQTLVTANPFILIAAFLTFNLSKIIAAGRLLLFYQLAGVKITPKTNLLFYYMGMFYNMFLPGSIGGDAYKVYLLKQNQQDLPVKKLISASLLDRVSGVSFLFVMAAVFLYLSSFNLGIPNFNIYLWAAILLIIPMYYVAVKVFFSSFASGFIVTGFYSFFVQTGQVICAVLILKALHIDMHYWDYLTLFMLSSVVAILPLTVGGFGARELVFLFGARFMHINEPTSIAFTLVFFMITAASSLIGLFFIGSIDKKLIAESS
jgi:uncharacterized membrane protein YbhN (UPF0104 family)